MTTFVTVRPPPAVQPQRPVARPLPEPGRGIPLLGAAGIADALYLCYVHVFETSQCVGGAACGSVLASEYSRALGVPLAAFGLGLFAAIVLAAAQRALGWVRLLAVSGAVVGLFLAYVQAARLHAWCPFCLVSTGLLVVISLLSLRGGRALVDLALAPRYLAAVALPVALVAGVERGIAERDVRRALAPSVPVATIAGERVPLDAVPEVGRLEWEAYRARLRFVEQEVLKREAAVQRTTVEALVRENVDLKVLIPEAEILARYGDGRGPGGPSREERMEVAAQIALERRPAVEAAYLKGLFEKYRVAVDLRPPGARERIPLSPRGGPVRGPEDAKLEIVVFSDFSCPTCARVHEWLKALDVPARVGFRHLPLGPPGPAAYAAYAAHEQGKFFEFADVLYRNRAALDPAKLTAYAAEARLDMARFQECLASDRPRAAVAADMEEARALGVASAPTLFLNGVHFVGVPDARLLRSVIERDGR